MKKVLLMAAAIILLASCQETLEERAAREAREVTEAKCPMPIGNNMYLDSIVFDITFDDDSYGFVYRISGQRYTGFYE